MSINVIYRKEGQSPGNIEFSLTSEQNVVKRGKATDLFLEKDYFRTVENN